VCLKLDLLYIISGEFHFHMFMPICKYVSLCAITLELLFLADVTNSHANLTVLCLYLRSSYF
jgi:hypothetical protein